MKSNKVLRYIMSHPPWSKIFWRLYFWWGIRQARNRRLENEKRFSEMPKLSNDEYWERVKNKQQNP